MLYVPDGDAELYVDGEKYGNMCLDIFGLDATIPLMRSKDYRDRFVAEWAQTKIRLGKLSRMLQRYYGGTLDFTPECPILLLKEQASLMTKYVKTLETRADIEGIKLKL